MELKLYTIIPLENKSESRISLCMEIKDKLLTLGLKTKYLYNVDVIEVLATDEDIEIIRNMSIIKDNDIIISNRIQIFVTIYEDNICYK